MPRRKLKHFAQMKEWPHVFEPQLWTKDQPGPGPDELNLKGSWGENVIVELGCGSGDYSLGLGARFPNTTVVGVDIKGSRLWHGAERALDLGLKNVSFLRIRIEDLAHFFAQGEVDEIWLTFPDPHPSRRGEKRRLTSPRFLELYGKVLKPGGLLHLKTDSRLLFDYGLEILPQEGFTMEQVVEDVYADAASSCLQAIQTAYEKKYLKEGRQIRYACFKPKRV